MKPPFQLFELKKILDPRFIMSPIELKEYINFEVKRVYFVTKTVQASGAHCHTDEKEFFILVQGTCEASIDQGNGLETFHLQAPTSAVYVAEYIWHQFKNFSPDAILLALSSTNYDTARPGYIENYQQYLGIRDQALAARS